MKSKLHLLPAECYPVKIRIFARSGPLVWEATVERPDGQFDQIRIPGFAGTPHWPVRVEIEFANQSPEV